MDFDEERDFADQGPLTDIDMEEDAQILATLLKHLPSCINAADMEHLLQDIPVQPPVAVPARTMQEAIEAKDLPPLDVDASNVFSTSERILQEHVCKHGTKLSIGPGTVPTSIVLFLMPLTSSTGSPSGPYTVSFD